MSELLLELFSEEIPARMQARAADDLRRLVTEGLKAHGPRRRRGAQLCDAAAAGAGHRGRAAKSPAVRRRGRARASARRAAIAGFLKGAGLKSIDEAKIVKDDKKGDFYVARIEKPGRAARRDRQPRWCADVVEVPLAEVDALRRAAQLRWVRPLHSIVCLLDGKVVPFVVAGIEAAGHHARPSLPRQRAVQGEGLRRLPEEARGGTRSCSIRPSARR